MTIVQIDRSVLRPLVILSSVAVIALVVNAQRQRDLYVAPGKVVAEGTNTVATGELKVKSYRLEEVKLPKRPEPTRSIESEAGEPKRASGNLNLSGEQELRQRPDKVLRLTITGEIPPRNYVIWIDDEPLENVSNGPELIVLVHDPSVLQDGATIAVSLFNRPKERTALPELLRVPAEYQVRRLSPAELGNSIVALRGVVASELRRAGFEIVLTRQTPYPITNIGIALRIGQKEFFSGRFSGDRQIVTFWLTPEEFAELKDGDRVSIKIPGSLGHGEDFGRLDKSLLRTDDNTKND